MHPLPRPPEQELEKYITTKTIIDNPSLFKIISPIHVDAFEHSLTTCPNQLFVQSVCAGLRHGFWPWADTMIEGYPTTHDASNKSHRDHHESLFLQSQIEIEAQKHRFSPTFGTDLLLGMYSMPIYGVPKTLRNPNLRMVTDQSAG